MDYLHKHPKFYSLMLDADTAHLVLLNATNCCVTLYTLFDQSTS